jgi:hypothetical protein
MRGGNRIAPVVAGLLVAAYVAAFCRFGVYDLADEGLLLAQAARTAAGERPYVDFHTGYGPLYFALQAALVRAGGLEAVRGALAVVHGATAALLFAGVRVLGGTVLAVAAVALHVAFFLPVAPARGAPFNVPYPAWYAGLAAVAVALLLLRGRERRATLALAGAIAGAVFAMKPNSGGLLVAAAAVAGVVEEGGRGAAGRRVVGSTVLVLAVLAVVLLVSPTPASGMALVLVAPVAALAWRARDLVVPDAAAAPRIAALGAGFVAVLALALGPTVAALGAPRFAHEVLHLGAGVADLFLLPIGWPAVAATLVGLATLAAGAPRAGVLAGLALLAAVAATGGAEAPAAVAAARLGAERAAIAAVPLALLGGVALLAREPRIAPVLAVAVLGAGQLYPRPDFDHLMPVAPLVLPIALLVWRAAIVRLGAPGERAAALAAGVALLVAGARFVPSGRALVAVLAGRTEAAAFPGGSLVALPEGSERLRAIEGAAAAVAASAAPDERVVAFPACAAITFLAGRLPAGPHDYFYPGRPTRAEVATLVTRLRAAPPPAAVTCATPGRLSEAWQAYPELVSLLTERYRVVFEHGSLVVRRRMGGSWESALDFPGVGR